MRGHRLKVYTPVFGLVNFENRAGKTGRACTWSVGEQRCRAEREKERGARACESRGNLRAGQSGREFSCLENANISAVQEGIYCPGGERAARRRGRAARADYGLSEREGVRETRANYFVGLLIVKF